MKNKPKLEQLADETIQYQSSKKARAQPKSANKTLRQRGQAGKATNSASEQLACLKLAQQQVKKSSLFRALFLISGLLVSIAAYFLLEAGEIAFIWFPALLAIALMQLFFNYQVSKVYRQYLKPQEPA